MRSNSRSFNKLNPIIVDLLMKGEVVPEQLGMSIDDINKVKEEKETTVHQGDIRGYPSSLPLVFMSDSCSQTEVPVSAFERYWGYLRVGFLLSVLAYLCLRAHFFRRYDVQPIKYTIRVNTFRRNDLLANFLSHYVTCADVDKIQVVWSDLDNMPPDELVYLYEANSKVTFELHEMNSLSNRFKVLGRIDTGFINFLIFESL